MPELLPLFLSVLLFNECHALVHVPIAPISADSHGLFLFFVVVVVFQDCCPGLGTTRGKQEEERLHMSLASLQITGNCALFSLPLAVFYSKVKLHHVQ